MSDVIPVDFVGEVRGLQPAEEYDRDGTTVTRPAVAKIEWEKPDGDAIALEVTLRQDLDLDPRIDFKKGSYVRCVGLAKFWKARDGRAGLMVDYDVVEHADGPREQAGPKPTTKLAAAS